MAAPYFLDLRRKVVQACERHTHSQREVAELFGVSRSFVESVLRRFRRSGELVPVRQRPGRHAKISAASCDKLRQWLQDQPDLTLAELAQRLQRDCGVTVWSASGSLLDQFPAAECERYIRHAGYGRSG